MRRLTMAGLMTMAILGVVGTQEAAAQQQISFSVGGFSPNSATSRVNGDVLVGDLDFLAFRVSDFSGPLVGAEYLTALGDHFDAGFGVGFFQRTVPTVYTNLVNANGSDIQQDLKLRVIPFTASVRWLPMGHHNGIEPYIGAGVGVFNYRYSEIGDFVASDNVTIINGSFVGSGTATGPVILGGVRVPVGVWGVGGEIRYQSASGNLPADQGFAGSKIDLGGLTYTFTINIRF
jgi:outer membrane protein W